MGVNALEYFLEVPGRTWEQFLEFFDDLCEEQGTKLWAAAATDPALLARVQSMTADELAELREHSTAAEPHYGYTREVREWRNLADQVIALRAQMGRVGMNEVTFMPRPQMVGDLINERQSELTRSELDDIIAEAQAEADRLGIY
ncbi:hypothetical protein [Mycolicibacterium wolinskyi]|uniref:hypothetical protein n=1 Tax=Mycolicibacterium wolinskyi TaxID=59750 RepID=UPI0039178EE2